MKVVLAEKPSVAKELAKVLGASNKKDGFIEGNGYIFTWAFGHLVQLASPQEYGYNLNGWDVGCLPMIPTNFKLVPRQLKGKDGYYDDPGVTKQLKIIRGCFEKADEIIVATDAGREGELIFRYIYEYIGVRKPFKRLWISSQTDSAIREGFLSLKNGEQYDRLYASAKARSESDWLVGMNATQALSLSVSDKTLYSIGRVQTPTLAMICSRFQEFTEFKPVVYYQLELLGQKEAQLFKALSDRRWEKESEALAALLLVKKESYATILEVEKKEKREPSPLLYDLTSLQQDANRIYGYTAEETLGIAQTLYESKYLTYPRTGSRYIGEDVFLLIPDRIKLFKGVEKYTGTVSFLQSVALNKRSVNDAKVTDHHALLPTENLASELTGRDKDIYEMVVSRMMEAFHQTCIKEVVKVSIRAGELFSANGTTITYAGWRGVQNLQEKEDTESEATELPLFEKGDKVIVQEVVSVEKRTKPKPLHSEATLLKAMETCGSDIEDDSVRELMKESGLGTPATRAAIIEVLIAREYVIRKKKTLVPTEKGLSVYRLVKDKEIAMPEMTGGWEKKFALIERGEMKASSFAVQIKEYAKEITVQLLGSGKDIRAHQAEKGDDKVHCPKCKVGEISHVNNSKLYAWVCSEREACGFILYGEIAGKKLSEAQGKMLILNKRSKLIKGFKSVKTGKLFDAVLCIGDDFKVRFDFGK